jgi:hypothetical protein
VSNPAKARTKKKQWARERENSRRKRKRRKGTNRIEAMSEKEKQYISKVKKRYVAHFIFHWAQYSVPSSSTVMKAS